MIATEGRPMNSMARMVFEESIRMLETATGAAARAMRGEMNAAMAERFRHATECIRTCFDDDVDATDRDGDDSPRQDEMGNIL